MALRRVTCDACAGAGWLWVNYLRRLVSCPSCQEGGVGTVAARAPAIRRDLVFSRYGRACNCCGATENLTIDHVFGGGREHLEAFGLSGGQDFYQWLISNDFPAGFQVLCSPCNSSKGEGKRCRRWHPRASRGEAG